jgi:uncharacterized protein with ParB-like and HNH nuclease domain
MESFKANLKLSQLFSDTKFIIPDYQRGYSWGNKQLSDIFEDIINAENSGDHYTGLITVAETTGGSESWTELNPVFVIDGQQRLTTLIILIKVLIEKAKILGMNDINSIPITGIVSRYLYKINSNNENLKASILEYGSDPASDEFFKSKILEISQVRENVNTAYTRLMRRAVEFFKNEIKNYSQSDISKLFTTVTSKLIFNLYNVKENKEVNMIFESMNYRGKGLSILELLKNRLMYITEKLPSTVNAERETLREHIKKAWKKIYEWLGKNELLNDDDFLRDHWIMYLKGSDAKRKSLEGDLLNDIFLTKRIFSKERTLKYDFTDKYIISLSDAVEHWYYIKYPEQAKKEYDERVIHELLRIKRIGYTHVRPLILALLMREKSGNETEKVIKVLKKSEEYIFKVISLTGKSVNTGDSMFYRLAKKLNDNPEFIDEICSEIDDGIQEYFNIAKFFEDINELFSKPQGLYSEGFYKWDYIYYFLFEYDLYLKERGGAGREINWDDYIDDKGDYESIEHIYPKTDSKECWQKVFEKYNADQKRWLKGSLGNLLPLSKARNSARRNDCFTRKKNNGEGDGYYNGSHSEAEVNLINEWNAQEILNRGMNMLKFMENRWHIEISNKEKLLHIEFLLKAP